MHTRIVSKKNTLPCHFLASWKNIELGSNKGSQMKHAFMNIAAVLVQLCQQWSVDFSAIGGIVLGVKFSGFLQLLFRSRQSTWLEWDQ